MKIVVASLLVVSGTLTGQTRSQTLKGVLMDASCAAITSESGLSSNEAVRNSISSTSAVTQSGRASSTEGLRNNSPASQNMGVTAGQARETTAAPVVVAREQAKDEQLRIGSNASGTSQIAGAAATPDKSPAWTAVTSPSEGERGRPDTATVQEKYAGCAPAATTTSFALHTEGKLYVIDDEGNDLIRRQMSGEAFRAAMSAAKWISVTVEGSPAANGMFHVTSIRK